MRKHLSMQEDFMILVDLREKRLIQFYMRLTS